MKKKAILKCFLFLCVLTAPTLGFSEDSDRNKDNSSANSGTQTQDDKNETASDGMSYREMYERVVSSDFSKLTTMDD